MLNDDDPAERVRQAQMRQLASGRSVSGLASGLASTGYDLGDDEPAGADPYGGSAAAPRGPANYSGAADYDPEGYTSGVKRRGGSGGGGFWSGAGKGALAGTMIPIPGVGSAVGAAVGGIMGAINKKAKSAPTDFGVQDARQAITDAYTDANGRPPTAAEVDDMIKGQGWQPGDRYVGEKGLNYILGQIGSNAQTNLAAGDTAPDVAAGGAPPMETPLATPTAGNTGITPPAVLNAPTAPAGATPAAGAGPAAAAPGAPAAAVPGAPGATGDAAPGAATPTGEKPPVKPGTGGPPPGFDAGKWETSTSPKYVTARALSGVADQLKAIPDEAGRKAFMEDQLTKLIPELEAGGAQVLDVKGEKLLIDAGDGKGPLWIDTIRDIEGDADVQWIEPDGGDTGGAGGGAGGVGGMSYGGLTDAGLDPALSDPKVLQQIMQALGNVPRSDLERQAMIAQLGGGGG